MRLISPDLFPPPDYAHVAVASGRRLVHTAGAVPLDRNGELVGHDDYEAQARQVLVNLVVALELAGATPADVVKTTVYVVPDEGGGLARVWDVVRSSELAGAPSTLLGVQLLGYTGQLVEIEAVAVVD
jgi:enamine deaminase RidA (YjgF/YER057c/UK114 family)